MKCKVYVKSTILPTACYMLRWTLNAHALEHWLKKGAGCYSKCSFNAKRGQNVINARDQLTYALAGTMVGGLIKSSSCPDPSYSDIVSWNRKDRLTKRNNNNTGTQI